MRKIAPDIIVQITGNISFRIFLIRPLRKQPLSRCLHNSLILGKIRAAAGSGGIGSARCRERPEDRVREATHARDLSVLHGVQTKIETSRAQRIGRRTSRTQIFNYSIYILHFFISASNSFHLFLVFLDISANSILLSESSENVQLPRRSRSRYGGTHQSCTREHADGICLQKTGLLCPSQKLQQVKILIELKNNRIHVKLKIHSRHYFPTDFIDASSSIKR